MRYILIFFMFFETLFSQNKPNYEEIKINTISRLTASKGKYLGVQ